MKKAISIRSVIPNIITVLGLSLGLTAIKFTLVQNFHSAIICIVLAAVLDAADGRIARLIKGTSKFGAELDSLADFVNFGVAPALMLYIWDLNVYGNLGWVVTLIYIIGVLIGAFFLKVWGAETSFIKTISIFVWTIIFLIALFYADKHERKN